MSRKGPYQSTIRACRPCHTWFDTQPAAFRREFADVAAATEAEWLATCAQGGRVVRWTP